MRSLSSSARSPGDDTLSSSDADFDPVVGWETQLSPTQEKQLSADQLIRVACNKLPLLKVLRSYQIRIDSQYGDSGWAPNINCPFPDHADSSPSFGYNHKEDRFYCLGCQRSGRSVHFISIKEGKSPVEIAKSILDQYGFDILEEDLSILDDSQAIQEALHQFSLFCRSYIKEADDPIEALSFVEKVSPAVDYYLAQHLPDDSVKLEMLTAIIEKVKDRLV